jgi:hypothetical protein
MALKERHGIESRAAIVARLSSWRRAAVSGDLDVCGRALGCVRAATPRAPSPAGVSLDSPCTLW